MRYVLKSLLWVMLTLSLASCASTPGQPPVTETDLNAVHVLSGDLTLRASAYHNATRTDHYWEQEGVSLSASPNKQVNIKTDYVKRSPRLDYNLEVARAGTYYVWVRGWASAKPLVANNSVHIGEGNQANPSGERISGFSLQPTWSSRTMSGERSTVTLGAGRQTLNVWMREDGFVFDRLFLTREENTKPQGAASEDLLPPAEEDREGNITLQAVDLYAREATDKHDWQRQGELMVSLPDVGHTSERMSGPRLDYRVAFESAGTYYVWVRGASSFKSPHTSDSLHVGLNGKLASGGTALSEFKSQPDWSRRRMDGNLARIEVSEPGVHIVNVWMREDGAGFSTIFLTKNKARHPDAPDIDPDMAFVKADSAAAFVDTIGVNTHFHYQGTVYDKGYKSIVKPKLLESGIRHVRDGAYTYKGAGKNTFFYKRLRELGAAGVRFNLITNMDTKHSEETDWSKLGNVYDWSGGYVTSFEGVNEPDIQGVSDWVDRTRAAQKSLWNAVQKDPKLKNVDVLGPSPVWKKATLGDLGDYLDYGNTHPYPGGLKPTGSHYGATTRSNLEKTTRYSGGKPVVFTETGYHNAVGKKNNHPGVSEEAAGDYMPRLLLDNYSLNVPRTYLYEFIDSKSKNRTTNPEASFGLLRNDGSEKPAFRAVRDLIRLLEGEEPAELGAIQFELRGDLAGVRSKLLQGENGTYYLALWREVFVYDRGPRTPIEVTPKEITVALGKTHASLKLHEFTEDGSLETSTLKVSREVGVSLAGRVAILELR